MLLLLVIISVIFSVSVTERHGPNIDWDRIQVSSGNSSTADGFWVNPDNVETYGDLIDVRRNRSLMNKFNEVEKFVHINNLSGGDNETIIAVHDFFWGMSNGIVLELGATNGVNISQSLPFERLLGWHRILIDGDPQNFLKLQVNVDSLAFNCAICENEQVVHYVTRGDTSGILEFMNPAYMKMFFRNYYIEPKSEWIKRRNVFPVHCIPLQSIFKHANISHVNFFVLDVEGGELDVLKSINFASVMFDVIVVETDWEVRHFRPPGYVKKITTYLQHQGYKFVRGFGRNSWFVNQFFTPSKKV